ncbi:MAG: ribosomal protein S6--L-glutamate ligase [Patescibacteria group bacterium]|nr:RimK family alpha-L-glutamate ligase [Candidatus Saccharibacteria bacterium]MDQ5963022.1 ribosomal protein S6--L-glutamate ligase [Patescibacteria group bacterium]
MNSQKSTIGRAEKIELLDFGIVGVPGKTDTGADMCSIWATKIEEREDALYFTLFAPSSPHYTGKEQRFTKPDYSLTRVANSFGQKELRYKVKLRIKVAGRSVRATFTLSDRSKKTYPILLGRKLLHGKFLVDVTSGEPLIEAEEAKAASLKQDLDEMLKPNPRGLKIAILSKGSLNYTTKRLREVAALRGHDVRVINYAKCYMTMEKSKPVVYYKGEALPKFDVIIPRIAQSYTKYGTAVVRQFEMQGAFSTASSIAINRSRDKLRSYQIMARQDVGIPKTVFARETANLEEIVDLAGGAPVIIKVARGTHGNGVVLAETKKAAKAVMQAFYVEGVNFIVQEFVQESAGTDIRALIVGNRVVASIQRQSLDDDFRSNTHQGGVGKRVKLTAEEEKTAIRAAKAMSLPICGVDMMRSADGPKVLEVNSSASIKTPELITKRDVSTKIIEYIERNAKAKHKKDKIGA